MRFISGRTSSMRTYASPQCHDVATDIRSHSQSSATYPHRSNGTQPAPSQRAYPSEQTKLPPLAFRTAVSSVRSVAPTRLLHGVERCITRGNARTMAARLGRVERLLTRRGSRFTGSARRQILIGERVMR